VSAAGPASVEELVGQVLAQVLDAGLALGLVARLAVVPNSNMALSNALVHVRRTTSRRCCHCTRGSQSNPSANCSCQQLEESEQMSAGQASDLAKK